MSDKTIVTALGLTAGTIYAVAVTAAYQKGKRNGRKETIQGLREMARTLIKQQLAEEKAV